MPLENALKIAEAERFIKNSSGLQHPEKLVEIGDYLGRTAWFYIPDSSRVRAAWLGGDYNIIYIDSNSVLDGDYAARGVRC